MRRLAMPGGLTRRQLVRTGTGAVVGVALAPSAADARQLHDRDLLRRALAIERLVAWGYEHVLAVGPLSAGTRALVAGFLEHERQHVALLQELLRPRSLRRLTTRAALSELGRHQIVAGPGRLRTQHASLRLLVDLESLAEGTWFGAISKLREPELAALAAEVMACEAQHWTMLSMVSHHGDAEITVPNAFVRGTS